MTKKVIAIVGIVLLSAVVGPLLTDWWLRTREPALRKGMTEEEVAQLLGKRESTIGNARMRSDAYPQGPDVFGNRKMILVNVGADGRVISWIIEPLPRSRPGWLGGSE